MANMKIFVFLLALAAVQTVRAVVVECPDQQQSCICDENEDVCEFTLRIEDRQSFVSYAKNSKQQLTYDDGNVYSLSSSGYEAVRTPRPGRQLSGCANVSNGRVDEQDFIKRNCSVPLTLDGVSYRSVITVNGGMPGPTLVVTSQQTVVVHLINRLISDVVTVHWHGIFQKGTPWMDGVAFISQPPINPGATFDYVFTADPTGTFWYHSHVGTQRTDGLFGALVIRDKPNIFQGEIVPRIRPEDSDSIPVIDMPDLYTMTLIDWQIENTGHLFTQHNSSTGFYTEIPIAQVPTSADERYVSFRIPTPDDTGLGPIPFFSGLLNGRGRLDNDTLTPLSVFSVERGNIYRFRIIGASNLFAFKFSIDGHTLRTIATDGHYFQPQDVEYIIVSSGERFDFLLDTRDADDETNYWIRAETLELGEVEHSARGILTYGDANNLTNLDWTNGYSNVPESRHSCTVSEKCRVLNCPWREYGVNSTMTCINMMSLSALLPKETNRRPKFPPSEDCTDCMQFLNFAFQGPDGPAVNAMNFELPSFAYQTNCDSYNEGVADNTINTCDNCEIPNDDMDGCRCTNVVPIANGAVFDRNATEHETIVLVFSGLRFREAHPIHLHGHSFEVLYIGYGNYDDDGFYMGENTDIECSQGFEGRVCAKPRWANGGPPEAVLDRVEDGRVIGSAVLKDTVILPVGGYVIVAFQADNPGYWFLHCHVEEHQLRGMGVLMQEYNAMEHIAPPDNINNHGSFDWDVEAHNTLQQKAVTCASLIGPEIVPLPSENASITLPVAGFGVMLAVIAILAVSCAILVVMLLITCCCRTKKPKKSSPTNLQHQQPTGEKIALSENTYET